MTYETVFLNTFQKQFKKLPTEARERAKQKVQQPAENPYLGLRLRGQLEGFRKDRIEDYRMIFKD